ncbi:MAG: thioesterase [Tardiphaga sp.]|jgi:uncharacterized protein (TIGR00369 family)|nr:thioesterase [Tardiphaga sp.]MDB5521804.1 thioesterase [Tardiphaga sp.]
MTVFDTAAATTLLNTAFASWVRDLDLTIESVDGDTAVLRMAFSDKLCRDNNVVCGQALMSLADTAMVFAISSAAGGYLPMTTVDQTIHFLKPASRFDLLAEARVIRLGKTMAFGSVTIRASNDAKPVALAQTAYALLRDTK